jgi:uncharacterized protein YbjT (DUF2867 family)
VSNNIQHFVFSSLDDVAKASNGKVQVPHFTNKNRVEQEARESSIPNCTFVYPPFYADNLRGMMFRLNEDKSSASIYAGVNPDRKLPVFAVDDMGVAVSEVFNNPDQLVAGDYITFSEMADTCSTVLNIPTRYIALDEDPVGKQWGTEMRNMFNYFNQFGYYQDNEEEAVRQSQKLFPRLLTFQQFVQQNKSRFIQ